MVAEMLIRVGESGINKGATVAMICRRNVHCSGTGHSSSVTHTAEDD